MQANLGRVDRDRIVIDGDKNLLEAHFSLLRSSAFTMSAPRSSALFTTEVPSAGLVKLIWKVSIATCRYSISRLGAALRLYNATATA